MTEEQMATVPAQSQVQPETHRVTDANLHAVEVHKLFAYVALSISGFIPIVELAILDPLGPSNTFPLWFRVPFVVGLSLLTAYFAITALTKFHLIATLEDKLGIFSYLEDHKSDRPYTVEAWYRLWKWIGTGSRFKLALDIFYLAILLMLFLLDAFVILGS